MTEQKFSIEQLAINTIRTLAIDAVQKANSGHPGMPLGCAPIVYLLYYKLMKHNPSNPNWINRDRFILSAGHGSMLLYSVLHLSGYDLSLDELKNFRQWNSKTPGHPEYGHTPGVETTTGPLGQGFATAIGMAVARDYLASIFNKDEFKLFDHYIYGICSDGDLMEGISHEAASFAGHHKLGKIIFFYDDNRITIEGKTDLTYSDDVQKRFEAYGWNVYRVEDVNNLSELENATNLARQNSDKPCLIITRTHIGYGSPNKQDTAAAHGAPLGVEEVKLTKKNLGWHYDEDFFIPAEVKKHFAGVKDCGKEAEELWNRQFEEFKKKYSSEAELFERIFNGNYGNEWENHLPEFSEAMATRAASGKVLNAIAPYLPTLIGGSADLAESNNTHLKEFKSFSSDNKSGRNLHFGVREHAMGAMLNGMALYGGLIPYGGTFLIFSDYLRPALRLSALMKLRTIFVFTHDSIGLGEDGPTHQPIEQLAALRAIPNVIVVRPADPNETTEAWHFAINHKGGPVLLVLTRQKVECFDRNSLASASELLKGAYILKDSSSEPDIILMASGSEVGLIMKASEKLEAEGIKTRVVSFPSWEIFEMQSEDYKRKVLPSEIKTRLAVEAGVKQGWEKYVGEKGDVICMNSFGASAPDKVLFEKFGFTVENVIKKAKEIISKKS
ncbi:transketolase [Ignavibacterium sp.]|jgi:transketolase|uniref:transketolase n=1 Tax=Ignavibacterium sp. TaxID=2651167 RepID=UPI0025C73DA6|nr:transketolase [Ignavibacterium sp.]